VRLRILLPQQRRKREARAYALLRITSARGTPPRRRHPARRPPAATSFRILSAVMVAAFVLAVLQGHAWVSIAVIAMKLGMLHEILGLDYAAAVGSCIPLWRST
jgi:hypothetical protein